MATLYLILGYAVAFTAGGCLVVAVVVASYWLLRHDHENGHCGWSGCQAGTPGPPQTIDIDERST